VSWAAGETVQVVPRIAGARDAHGNETATYGTAVPYEHCGVALTSDLEPNQPNRDLSVTALTIIGPSNMVANYRDRVIVRGETYEAVGPAFAWKHLFSNWEPGVVLKIEKAVG